MERQGTAGGRAALGNTSDALGNTSDVYRAALGLEKSVEGGVC